MSTGNVMEIGRQKRPRSASQKSFSDAKNTEAEPTVKSNKMSKNFTVNDTVDRLQHDEAGNWISATIST